MNILHILGNGFDLNLGLKTGYKDFYDFYSEQESPNELIIKLKREISNNYKNWSDLELALGSYTSELKTLQDFDIIFEDIRENLSNYLVKQEENFDFEKINSSLFYEHLVKPEKFLTPVELNELTSFKNKFSNMPWNIDVFTFNYTTAIEKIVKVKNNTNIGYHPQRFNVLFKGVHHIHGYVDNKMVLGVNDITQLRNKNFHDNIDIIEAIVKENCNKGYRHNIDERFKSKINQAKLISIFGSSLGDTDNIWWELIGQKLHRDKIPLLIFTKGEEVISSINSYKTNRTERKMRDYFLKKTQLTSHEQEEIRDNIYVAIDSMIFKKIKNLK